MRLPLHPLLFAAFPILFLFRENLWGLERVDVVAPLAITVGAVLLAQVVLSLLTGKPRKVAAIVSVVTLLFLSYGHVWRLVADRRGRVLGIDADIALGIVWIGLAAMSIVLVVRTTRLLPDLTRLMNVFAFAMVGTVAVPLVLSLAGDGTTGQTAQAAPAGVAKLAAGESPAGDRDIYYLVFDRYAGARSLQELFGYDNHELLDDLESKGFEIADTARANYQSTVPSLATSLNMRYLDWIAESLRGKTKSTVPLMRAIRDHEVGRFLQEQGYRYVHVGSRWDMTRDSPIADVNVRLDDTSEFTRVFLGSTALLPAMRHGVLVPDDTDSVKMSRRVTLRQFEEVVAAKRFKGPKFVFAHFGLPHPPYVFDRYGKPVDDEYENVAAKARAYFQQLQYGNTRIRQTVDELLDVPKGKEPIIILQADEGPYPSFGWVAPKQWWTTTDRKLRTKFSILMATYMPGIEDTGAYESLSPVNVFRLVFNNYFDADLPLLPDESWVPTDKDTMYEWTNISDRLGDPDKLGPPLYPPRVPVLPPIRRAT